MEYISLHRYIRNTPSDIEVHAEHELELTGTPDQQKRLYRTTQKLSRMKEVGGKTGVLTGLDLPLVGGETEAGV